MDLGMFMPLQTGPAKRLCQKAESEQKGLRLMRTPHIDSLRHTDPWTRTPTRTRTQTNTDKGG
jgi:hypothetical protein